MISLRLLGGVRLAILVPLPTILLFIETLTQNRGVQVDRTLEIFDTIEGHRDN